MPRSVQETFGFLNPLDSRKRHIPVFLSCLYPTVKYEYNICNSLIHVRRRIKLWKMVMLIRCGLRWWKSHLDLRILFTCFFYEVGEYFVAEHIVTPVPIFVFFLRGRRGKDQVVWIIFWDYLATLSKPSATISRRWAFSKPPDGRKPYTTFVPELNAPNLEIWISYCNSSTHVKT